MSDNEGDVNVSVSLPKPTSSSNEEPVTNGNSSYPLSRSPINANSELDEVKEILKSSQDADPLEDKSSFYPLQQKTAYMSPVCTLSSDSKKIIRQAQAPILQASPRVVHFLYEVSWKVLPGMSVASFVIS